ncbi:MAG: hypothetical protein ACFFC7_08915 [Candidatus Hermodarchaeota archaeon]
MLRRRNFYCPKCGTKLGKRQIDRKFTESSFGVSRDQLNVTINNAIATRKFPPELRDLAIEIVKRIFENHPDVDHTDLLWVTCLFCHYTTFVAPIIPEHLTLYAILPDSDDYSRILKDYERAEKEHASVEESQSLDFIYRAGRRMSLFSRHQLVFVICLGCGCSVVLFILFVVLIFFGLFEWYIFGNIAFLNKLSFKEIFVPTLVVG